VAGQREARFFTKKRITMTDYIKCSDAGGIETMQYDDDE